MKITTDNEQAWCEHCDDVLTTRRIDVWGTVDSGSKLPNGSFGQHVAIVFALCDRCIKVLFQ